MLLTTLWRECVVCNSVKCTLVKLLLLPSLSLQVSDTLQPRWGHSTTTFCLVDGVTEVTMFGGSADLWSWQSKLADTTLLQFCKYMNILIHDIHVCVMLLSLENCMVMLFTIIVIMSKVMLLLFCHAV